jgi:phage terminase Nu1 subunit (DNA packaging protein)
MSRFDSRPVSTEDVQNTVSRIARNIILDVDEPSTSMKRQFSKVSVLLIKLHTEIDLLNDMKQIAIDNNN